MAAHRSTFASLSDGGDPDTQFLMFLSVEVDA